eukprot:COSAG05_NODE_621_length_8305_cov_3.479283_2_plen_73_part_00
MLVRRWGVRVVLAVAVASNMDSKGPWGREYVGEADSEAQNNSDATHRLRTLVDGGLARLRKEILGSEDETLL